MSNELALIDSARRALAEAQSIPDVADLRDKAAAWETYIRRRDGAGEASHAAAELKQRAQRRLGQLLIDDTDVGRGKSGKLRDLGISHSDSSRWQRIATLPEPVFEEELAKPEPTTAALVKRAKRQEASVAPPSTLSPTCTVEDLEGLAESGREFGCVYADPPWQYGNQATRASTDNHYVTMPFDEIAALPIEAMAAEKSHLHLWTTNGFLREALSLIDAWGFEYKGLFLWVKPEMGIGNYWRVSHELMLLGVRGNAAFRDRSQMSWMEASRNLGHSAKPEGVRDIIEKVSPGPYLELFGRQAAPRWTVWGNEVERTLFAQAAEGGCG